MFAHPGCTARTPRCDVEVHSSWPGRRVPIEVACSELVPVLLLPVPSQACWGSCCTAASHRSPHSDFIPSLFIIGVLGELLHGGIPSLVAAAVAERVVDPRLAAWLHEPQLVQKVLPYLHP